MLIIRKYFKKYIYLIILILFGTAVIFHLLLSETKEYRDMKYKIYIIEELIQSNQNDYACQIPKLPIDNPEIMQFYKKKTDRINCGNSNDDWIQCNKSICSVKESIILAKGNIVCTYTDILRKNDYQNYYGKSTKTKDIYILKESDFVKVNCKSQNFERWSGSAIGIREKLDRKLDNDNNDNDNDNNNNDNNNKIYNILMFGFDSLSHNAFIRKLPKTYEYLTKILQTQILNGYNIVGDGTPQALIPILTGHNELELPETRKRISNSNYVDLYPMIWYDYEKFGYVTSFNEDMPNYGTFTYRLNGFNKQPTDHYLRTLYLEIENTYGIKYCIGNMVGHQVMLDYTKNFMMKYYNIPRFIFSFHGDLSHDSIDLIGNADNDVYEWLIDLNKNHLLENTILIMMSDHGNRFADVRNTLQGKQEERLPFFSFTFPNSFKRQFPKEFNNFIKNTNRLTTPFDIHETLLDILKLQNFNISTPINKHQLNIPPRGISLFNKISKKRSCAMAYIEPHWCSCLKWENLINNNNNTTDINFINNLGNTIVNTINNYTNDYRNICEQLTLLNITWVMKLIPNEKLISFKQSKDIDGFLADMSLKMNININLYQLKIIVLPGNSIFEANVSHDLINNKFYVKMSEISRINKYGNQANCIYDTNPDLRKYCYCKKQT